MMLAYTPIDKDNSVAFNAIVEIRISKKSNTIYNIELSSENSGIHLSNIDGVKAVYFRGVIEKVIDGNFTVHATEDEAWIDFEDEVNYYVDGGVIDPANYDIIIYALAKRDESGDITTQFLNCVLDWHY